MSDLALSELRRIAAAERSAILDARYNDLEDINIRKTIAIADLPPNLSGPKADRLQEILEDFESNQGLILAARKGIGAARERILALGNGAAPMTIYDQSGKSKTIQRSRVGVERRS